MENLLKCQEIITIKQETYYGNKQIQAFLNKFILKEN